MRGENSHTTNNYPIDEHEFFTYKKWTALELATKFETDLVLFLTSRAAWGLTREQGSDTDELGKSET